MALARRLAAHVKGCRSLVVSAGPQLQTQLEALRKSIADALEFADSACPSATQLMLETDPAARGPREQYELHYAELALGQLQAALDMRQQLVEQLGAEEADRLLRQEKLAVAAAECQLARDRAQQLIDSVRQRQQSNQIICDD